MPVHITVGAQWTQRPQIPFDLELQVTGTHLSRLVGAKPGSSASNVSS